LDYFGARYYSAPQGRFVSVDPENAGASNDNPQSWNGYSYGLNSPLRYVDRTGLYPDCYINGIAADCGFAYSLVGTGAGMIVPSGWPLSYYDYDDNSFKLLMAGAGGTLDYVKFSDLWQLNEWGGSFYNNSQFEKEILEPRKEAYKQALANFLAPLLDKAPEYVYSYLSWTKTVNGNANFAVDPTLDLSSILNPTNRYRTPGMPSAHIHTKDSYLIHLDMANPWTRIPLGALIHLFGDNILGRINGDVPFIY
jgi:hypothetical protein